MEISDIVIPVPTKLAYSLASHKQLQELRLWAILRHCADSSGVLEYNRAVFELTAGEFGVLKNVERILRRGNNAFWNITPKGKILLFSPSHIMYEASLGHSAGGHVTYIPFEYFRKLSDFRAAAFGAFLNKHDRPVSQEKLYQITGVKRSTQKSYRKKIKIFHVANIGLINVNGRHVPVNDAVAQTVVRKFRYVFGAWRDGQKYLAVRLPNTYRKVFKEDYSKRQSKRWRRSENRAAINQRFIRFFKGNLDDDHPVPENNRITCYSTQNIEKEHNSNKIVREIFGDDYSDAALPRSRDWEVFMPTLL